MKKRPVTNNELRRLRKAVDNLKDLQCRTGPEVKLLVHENRAIQARLNACETRLAILVQLADRDPNLLREWAAAVLAGPKP